MASCCVTDCFNRPSRKSTLQFHRIPSGTRPSQVHRRKLWLHALQPWIRQAKPSSTRLNGGARVCGAHFISGEMSLDHNNVDFIPSVFQGIKHPSVFKKGRKKRITRFMPKKRHRHKKEAGEEEMKTPPEADPVDEQSPVLMETESELSQELEAPSPPSVAKEAEKLTEMAEAEKGVGTITSQTTSSPNKTSPLVPAVRNLVVVLEPLILQAGGYEFQLCSRSLTTAAQPVEEEQPDEEETPCSCPQCVKPEEPRFPCNMCDRSFTSNHCLKRHKLLHVKDGRKCGKCGVLFCRRHNHTPFRPATDFKDASSGDELQTEESNVKPKKGVQQKSDQSWKPGAMTVKPWRRNATTVPTPPPTINTVPTPPSPTTTVPTAPPTINTVPTPPSPTTTVPTPSPTINTVPTPPPTINTVPTPPPPTINTVPTPPPPTINTVPTPPPTNTTVPIPSHSTTTVLTAPITATTTVPTPPPTTTSVPSPSHGTTTVPRGPTITFTTITTTTTRPTPPNPQPLSETHKFKPPSPEKRVQAKPNPAPSSASRPPPPVPGGSRNSYTSAAAVPPPTLPSSLKLFSPQYLTSALLQVTRNYEYILSKSKGDVKVVKVIKEEPSERPISPVEEIEEQIVEPVPKGRIAYDLEIVV